MTDSEIDIEILNLLSANNIILKKAENIKALDETYYLIASIAFNAGYNRGYDRALTTPLQDKESRTNSILQDIQFQISQMKNDISEMKLDLYGTKEDGAIHY